MIERWLVPAAATIFSFLLLLAALVSPFFLFLTLAPPPCENESAFYDLTRSAVPLSLLASAVWLYRLRHHPRMRAFLAALAISTIALGANAVAARLEGGRQAACEKRDLVQAKVSCGVTQRIIEAAKINTKRYAYPCRTRHNRQIVELSRELGDPQRLRLAVGR